MTKTLWTVERVEELLSQVSPGPWIAQQNARLEVVCTVEPLQGASWYQGVAHVYRQGTMNGTPYRMPAAANADFIAAAPEIIRWLLDENAELRATILRLTQEPYDEQ